MRHEARLAGVHLALTTHEFAILRRLVAADGAVVETAALLKELWDREADAGMKADKNVLFVHLCNLRGKLGERRKLLRSVRGVGYRLHAP